MLKPYLTDEMAQTIKDQAFKAAGAQSVPIAVTILDAGGHILLQARMEAAASLSLSASQRKAKLSLELRAPTHVLCGLAEQESKIKEAIQQESSFLLLPGGLPILKDGFCLGAVGIAGGNYQQDQAIAEGALAS